MNQTSEPVPGESLLPESTDLITGVHFGFILLFAVAAVLIIVFGVLRKRRRRKADHVMEDRVAVAEQTPSPPPPPPPVDDETPPPGSAPIEPAPAALPLTPAPPPLGEPLGSPPLAAEPIAAAASQDASPAAEAVPGDIGDDRAQGPLTQIKGLGPKVQARLAELGVTTVGDIAALDDAAATRLDAQLGPFTGRMARDRWIEQARLLAAGDLAGFEAQFGRL